MKKFIIILLVVLLVVAGLPFAYLAFSSGVYDTIFPQEELPLMSEEQRFGVDAGARTVSIRLDKNDIYRLLYDELGTSPLEVVNEKIAGYGLNAKNLGIRIDGEGLHLSAKLLYKRFLPLPVNCDASFNLDGETLQFTIDRVSIGRLIKINTSRFVEDLNLTYDMKDLNPIFEEVTSVKPEDGALLVSIPYPVQWLMDSIEISPSDYVMIQDFVSLDEFDTPAQAYFAYTDGDSSGILAELDKAETAPGKLCALKTDMLAIGGTYYSSLYFSPDAPASNAWLFPSVTKENVNARRDEILKGYQAIYDERVAVLDEAYEYLRECYADGRLLAKNGVLVFADNPKEPVNAADLEQLQGTEEWLNLQTVRVILGKNPGDYALRGMPGETVPVLILMTKTARPVVCLRKSSTEFLVKSLSGSDYSSYMMSKRTPIADIGIYTTQK